MYTTVYAVELLKQGFATGLQLSLTIFFVCWGSITVYRLIKRII